MILNSLALYKLNKRIIWKHKIKIVQIILFKLIIFWLRCHPIWGSTPSSSAKTTLSARTTTVKVSASTNISSSEEQTSTHLSSLLYIINLHTMSNIKYHSKLFDFRVFPDFVVFTDNSKLPEVYEYNRDVFLYISYTTLIFPNALSCLNKGSS